MSRSVLDELGIGAEQRAARLLEVWNKCDLLAQDELDTAEATVGAGRCDPGLRHRRHRSALSSLSSSTAASPSPGR